MPTKTYSKNGVWLQPTGIYSEKYVFDGDYSIPSGASFVSWQITTNVSIYHLDLRNNSDQSRVWGGTYTELGEIKSAINDQLSCRIRNSNTSAIQADLTLTITYAYPTRTVGISAGTGGTASAGASTASYGDRFAVQASAYDGYSFGHWSVSGGGSFDSVYSASTYFTMPDANVAITASFSKNNYTVTVASGGNGTVSGGGTAAYGSSVNISASPSSGYKFSKWTKSGIGTIANANAASTSVTIGAGNCTVTASFVKQSYTVSVASGGNGTVSGGGTAEYGSIVNISASPSTGYKFSKWKISGSGTIANANSASTSVTIGAGNGTVTATFVKQSYTLTTAVSPSGTGTASGGGTYEYNTGHTITATASTGYKFNGWTKSGSGTIANTGAASTTFTMGAANGTATANFVKNSYTLTVSASPAAGGSVSGGGTYEYASSHTIKATASSGYSFSGWTKSGSGSIANTSAASTTFTMGAGNGTATASFTKNSYKLTVNVDSTNGGTVSGGGTYAYQSSVTITATAKPGYKFTGWTKSGSGTIESESSASTTFTIGDGACTVTAHFERTQSVVRYYTSPSDGVNCFVKQWDGSSWVDVDLYRYNGSSWVKCSTLE